MGSPAPLIIAIDGPAASGKGTLARRIAERFGLAHLDTGKLYRATALGVIEAGGDPADTIAAEKAARPSRPALRPLFRMTRFGDAIRNASSS